jgi:hypothetical protein
LQIDHHHTRHGLQECEHQQKAGDGREASKQWIRHVGAAISASRRIDVEVCRRAWREGEGDPILVKQVPDVRPRLAQVMLPAPSRIADVECNLKQRSASHVAFGSISADIAMRVRRNHRRGGELQYLIGLSGAESYYVHTDVAAVLALAETAMLAPSIPWSDAKMRDRFVTLLRHARSRLNCACTPSSREGVDAG